MLLGRSVSCILCRGSILYFDETGLDKFSRHLQFEHGAMHDFDFLFAACKMNEAEKGALVSVFNKASLPGSVEDNLSDKPRLDQEKIAVVSQDKAPRSLFSSQKRRKINFKTFRKSKSSISTKNVGKNIIDVKSSKVTKVTCGKCGIKFKSRTKLFKHKALKHLTLSVKPRKGKLRKKVEPLKKPSYIAATTANKALEALVKDSELTRPNVKPEVPAQKITNSQSVEAPGPSGVEDIKDERNDCNPLGYLQLRKISPAAGGAQDREVIKTETPADTNARTPEKIREKEVSVETPKDPEDPDCVDCSQLSGSASKLSRHQRYVHGVKQDTPTRSTRRENKRTSVVPEEVTTPTKPPTPPEEESPTTPANIETPRRSCLKKSSSGQRRRLSVSFNRKVYFSDQTSLEHSESASDLVDLEVLQISPAVKRTSQETENIPELEPPSKRTKLADVVAEPQVKNSPEKVTESQPPEKNIKPNNNVKPQPSVSTTKPEAPVSQPPPSQPVGKLLIQRQCENCPEIFSTSHQLKSHTCVALLDKRGSLEKKNYVENTVRKDGRSCEEEIILDEAVIVRVEENVKTGFDVRPSSEGDIIRVTPTTTKSWIKLKNPSKILTVKPTTVSFPIESFLETVLVEEKGEINPSSEDTGPIHDLLKKYERRAKKVDFTKSNFFRKNAELLGGKSSGGGFKESLEFLPSNWRVKTYNEFKKFYLSPELIVLKSGAAVLEYLRLGYDLSHENLRTLADCLAVTSRVFNRYLDELFDDCVVID